MDTQGLGGKNLVALGILIRLPMYCIYKVNKSLGVHCTGYTVYSVSEVIIEDGIGFPPLPQAQVDKIYII